MKVIGCATMTANTSAQMSLRPDDAVLASMDPDVADHAFGQQVAVLREVEMTSTSRISEPNTQPEMRL